MKWFVFNKAEGEVEVVNDDSESLCMDKVIAIVRRALNDGYDDTDIVIIRGDEFFYVPPTDQGHLVMATTSKGR